MNDGITLQTILHTHAPAKCAGQWCCIHNPSAHHMREWTMHYRMDRGIMERICPHGVGHPDPDDITKDRVHGCDGCCQPCEVKLDAQRADIRCLRDVRGCVARHWGW